MSHFIRVFHRWISIVFTLGVIINSIVIAMSAGEPPPWIYALALVPLFMLLFSGLYLFALPYFRRRTAE